MATATNNRSASALTRALSSNEDWQDVGFFDGELFDPIFYQGDIGLTDLFDDTGYYGSFTSAYNVPESVTSDQTFDTFEPSAAVSTSDELSSFDNAISAPPSVVDDPPSIGHPSSWLSNPGSFSTAPTSPLVGRKGKEHSGRSNLREDNSPFRTTLESPFRSGERTCPSSSFSDDSFQTASTFLFNPHIANSPGAFSSLDVTASQAFANVGDWAEQPQINGPILELDHVRAIPIPHPHTATHLSNFPSCPETEAAYGEPNLARAITIPQPNHRAASYNHHSEPAHLNSYAPPLLSVSPDTRSPPKNTALARSTSSRGSRRRRNSLITPSPISNELGWVNYQPHHQTNRLVPSGPDGNKGKRQRGRTKGLTVEGRRNAALMRVVGSCDNCRRRKEKCDPGIPCKSCLEHYKGDLIRSPCRDHVLSDLSKAFLSDRLGWHPTARAVESFISPSHYDVSRGYTYTIPMKLGFGRLLHVPVHALQVYDSDGLYHDHLIYSWPPNSSTVESHKHAVLPAVLAPEALSSLPQILDTHLSLLVTQHFRSFPLYCSPLRILREIYVFFRSLPSNTSHSRLLHQALKLLVLVHIGGDLDLPSPSSDLVLAQLVRISMVVDPEIVQPTPCFIRAQLGSVMPTLALSMMKDVLSKLEQILLNRECQEWPIALAVLIVVVMTVESIHYHAAKLPYHHAFDDKPIVSQSTREEERKIDELGIKSLFTFYSACFSGCHARLKPDWEGEVAQTSAYATTGNSAIDPDTSLKPEDRFVESVRKAIRQASPGGYLAIKANGERVGEDMGFFFDRLVARLLLLKM
ncbi:hypothetical protein CC78DRAFT_181801 [Lojkania enalia]|uniref:Zn(2)-C6 fungal-type domain-containing protein n=1 Tax=Lojkania enalia TaxID=147567 RepID=A0A9P4N534_9PLEO|nr:hypothetical protein CC78DRAFT_181801 [Didymosphaeria enalia]